MSIDCFDYRFKPRSQVLAEKSAQVAKALEQKTPEIPSFCYDVKGDLSFLKRAFGVE
jgi:hypothetical protein